MYSSTSSPSPCNTTVLGVAYVSVSGWERAHVLQEHHHGGLDDLARNREHEFTDTSFVCCYVRHGTTCQVLQSQGRSEAAEHHHDQRAHLASLVPLWSVPRNQLHYVLCLTHFPSPRLVRSHAREIPPLRCPSRRRHLRPRRQRHAHSTGQERRPTTSKQIPARPWVL